MKKLVFSIAMVGSSLICSPVFSQGQIKDSLGLPGDNLNLYGVLDIFQQSKTLEEFEGKLNAQDSKINNLDLNGDNKIDYIKVVDNVQGISHAIVLKDEISEKELQDVAVIEVDKDKDGKIRIQIVGDEELYGKNYIVEPKEAGEKDGASGGTPNPGYSGNQTIVNNTTNNYYSNDDNYPDSYGGSYYPVNTWYMWDFLYAPSYVVYVSPWHWGYYPHYWNPWVPWYWHEYYGFHYHHYGYYHRAYEFRAPVAHGFYAPHRSVSVTVTHYRSAGTYRTTYARRDLLNKSMNENKAVRDNPKGQQNRDEHRNGNSKQNDVHKRNENGKVNDNHQRNENKVNNNQPRNNEPRNNTRENNQQRNNNQQVKPNRSERKAERTQERSQPRSQPQQRSEPRQNKPQGGGKRK